MGAVLSAPNQISLTQRRVHLPCFEPNAGVFAQSAANPPRYTSVSTKDQVGVNPIARGRYDGTAEVTPVFGVSNGALCLSYQRPGGGNHPETRTNPIARRRLQSLPTGTRCSGASLTIPRSLGTGVTIHDRDSPYKRRNVGYVTRTLATRLTACTNQFQPYILTIPSSASRANAPMYIYDPALSDPPSLQYNRRNITATWCTPGFSQPVDIGACRPEPQTSPDQRRGRYFER